MDTIEYAYQVNKFMYMNLLSDGWGMGTDMSDTPDIDIPSQAVGQAVGQTGGKCIKKKERRNFYLYNELAKFPGAINVDSLSQMFKTTVFRFFPPIDIEYMNKLQVNTVGLYSMTHYKDAAIMMDICRNSMETSDLRSLTVTVATSGIGGEVLNLLKEVRNLHAYEYSKSQYDILKNNVDIYMDYYESLGRKDKVTTDSDVSTDPDSDMSELSDLSSEGIEAAEDTSTEETSTEETYIRGTVTLRRADFTANLNEFDTDILIADPPWGGLNFKQSRSLDIDLGGLSMAQIAERSNAKVCLFKLPFNYSDDICKKLDALDDKFEVEVVRFIKYQVIVTKRL